ncbi:dynein regulatory complex protein 10, partial [Nematolebias whitei]|uniref:dynein regulatory complex protein 10 n=1 Tax=Nematolebias whitei TaxID=451745 RepID=UPI00189BE9B3
MQSEDTHFSLKEELSPEAERISRVLENCIGQVKIALCLPAILQFYSKSDVVDQDLNRILQAHQFLEEKLEKLEGHKKKQTTEEDRKTIQLKIDIKSSVRDVLRYFRNHPHVLSDLRAELPLEVGEKELIRTLELFHSHMVESLLSAHNENPHEILQNQTFSSSESLDLMMSQNQEVHEITKQLEEDLEQLEEEILRKSNEIESFKKDLKKETSLLQEKETSPLQEKQDELNELSSSSKLATLNTEINQLKSHLNNLMLENHQKQRILQEKNENLEIKTQTLLQTFDKNMEKLQAQLEALEKESIQEEMTKLQGPFSALEVQYNQIQEKRQLAEEKRKEEIRALELKSKAVVTIQAWWRGYSVRKALKNKGKSKSKKGKKIKKGTTKMGKLAETHKISNN